jgi:flagellar M-ring protein FliF
MWEKVGAVGKQLKEFWAGLPTPKRIALLVVSSAVLIGALVIATLGNRVTYGFLYTDLRTDDAAAIVEKLKATQVPYKLENNGTAIQVPEDKVHSLRLELAAAGLPKGGGVGFEIFDRSQIGSTEFEQQVNLKRAIEGELARSIMTVDGVRNARVHVVLPERRLFAAREESASVSVVMKLDNAESFGKREVGAIVHLVVAAVPGLSRERVSVVSTDGVTLHRPSTDAAGLRADLGELHTEAARGVAAQLEADVRAQLERVVGPGNADVRVSVDLDSAAREKTQEQYEPSKTALRSEHKVEETTGTEEAGVAGVPGARSNLPDAVPAAGAAPAEEQLAAPGGGGGALRRSHTRNWEVDKVTEKTTTPPGDIRRLSVAVLLNGKYQKNGEARQYLPRTKPELELVEQLVKRAVGFDPARGDAIEVKTAEFARPEIDDAPSSPIPPAWRRWLPYAAAALAGVVILAALVLVWRRKRRQKKAPAGFPALSGGPIPVALPAADARARLLEDPVSDEPRFRDRALELAAKDPATAAVVLRQWLNAPPPAAPARS